MKKSTNQKTGKEFKKILSPSSKKKKCIFNKNLFKDVEINNLALSHKKSQDELLLAKKEIVSNKNHRRIKLSYNNNFENMATSDKKYANKTPINQVSLNKNKKIKEKEIKNKTNKKDSISRNKNNYKKSYNILSICSSLKEFRNNINNNNFLNNEYNLNNKSVFNFDNSNFIEDTRNTTSINNWKNTFNNTNLLTNNKSLNKKEKEKSNQKTKKIKKINKKQNSKLNTSMDNNLKINYMNSNKKIFKDKFNHNYNLHSFIYRNKKPKNISNKRYYLNSSQKSFRNSEKNLKRIKNCKKLNINNSMSEEYNDYPQSFIRTEKKLKNNINSSKISKKYNQSSFKNYFPSSFSNLKSKIFGFPKKKKRDNNKSQVKNLNLKSYENAKAINEFDSVEEIHFKFIEINQRKNEFFEKYSEMCKKK